MKSITEQKIQNVANISSLTGYVKFASNYERARKFEENNNLSEAVKYYKAALINLESIENPDEEVEENIKDLKNRLKKLDNS